MRYMFVRIIKKNTNPALGKVPVLLSFHSIVSEAQVANNWRFLSDLLCGDDASGVKMLFRDLVRTLNSEQHGCYSAPWNIYIQMVEGYRFYPKLQLQTCTLHSLISLITYFTDCIVHMQPDFRSLYIETS